jgi:hypothetical protein
MKAGIGGSQQGRGGAPGGMGAGQGGGMGGGGATFIRVRILQTFTLEK